MHKKIILASTLLLSSFSVDALRLPAPSFEMLARQVASHHKADFGDWNAIDWSLLAKIISASEKRLKANSVDVTLNPFEHNDAVVKLMEPFVAYLKSHQADKNCKRLLLEVEDRIDNEECSPRWYTITVGRLLTSLSQMSQDEIDLLGQAGYQEFLEVLRNHPQDKLVPAEMLLEIFYNSDGISQYYHVYIPELPEADAYVERELEKANIGLEPATLFNKAELTLPTLLTSVFKGIPLAAAPTDVNRAHGVDMTPGIFNLHDWLHSEVDPRPYLVKKAIHDLYERLMKINANLSAQKVLEMATEMGIKRYKRLMSTLEELHTVLAGKFTVRHGIEAYRKIAVALFYVFHEEPQYDQHTFQNEDLTKTLIQLISKDRFGEEVEENALDLFRTDAETGLSPLTDDELVQIAYDNGLFEGEGIYTEFTLGEVIHKKVQRTSQRICITVSTKEGNYSFNASTLKYYWGTLEDEISLLNHAGIDCVRADLPNGPIGIAADRNAFAIAEITRVHELIKTLIDESREIILALIKMPLVKAEPVLEIVGRPLAESKWHFTQASPAVSSLAKRYHDAHVLDMMKAVMEVTKTED